MSDIIHFASLTSSIGVGRQLSTPPVSATGWGEINTVANVISLGEWGSGNAWGDWGSGAGWPVDENAPVPDGNWASLGQISPPPPPPRRSERIRRARAAARFSGWWNSATPHAPVWDSDL
ncbi:hypothetical protein B0H11DRAFT_2263193 [Mycena galericulata]|nr:hypothetical protein B0H11DRAFT_2263193 [Mycena galericulata]